MQEEWMTAGATWMSLIQHNHQEIYPFVPDHRAQKERCGCLGIATPVHLKNVKRRSMASYEIRPEPVVHRRK